MSSRALTHRLETNWSSEQTVAQAYVTYIFPSYEDKRHTVVRDSGDVQFYTKNWTLEKIHVFDWNESIKSIDLLTRFFKDDDMLNMAKVQTLTALPTFLYNPV